jgi:CRISPR system Cascade subunit CasC
MRHLELHILQSFPVSCMNRDELNSPKTAIFGGAQRARQSSQSWKRPIRKFAADLQPLLYAGARTRLLIEEIKKRLTGLSRDEPTALALASCLGHYLAKLDPKYLGKVKTMMFFSRLEIERLGELLHRLPDDQVQKLVDARKRVDEKALETDSETGSDESDGDAGGETVVEPTVKIKRSPNEPKKLSAKEFGKVVASVLKSPVGDAFRGKEAIFAKDAADVALFGRMVASDHSLTVEAAAMFSHAISTNKVDANELDFFSAVDDLQPSDEAGAGMTGTLEFNSATYYRFVGLNLDMLFDKDHLQSLTNAERRTVVETFVRATLVAYPTARQNSMHATTLPGFVLGVVRETGHPIQLVNAFERPIRPFGSKGLFELSVKEMLKEHGRINSTWGLKKNESWKALIVGSDYPIDKDDGDEKKDRMPAMVNDIPAASLEEFLAGLVQHVR